MLAVQTRRARANQVKQSQAKLGDCRKILQGAIQQAKLVDDEGDHFATRIVIPQRGMGRTFVKFAKQGRLTPKPNGEAGQSVGTMETPKGCWYSFGLPSGGIRSAMAFALHLRENGIDCYATISEADKCFPKTARQLYPLPKGNKPATKSKPEQPKAVKTYETTWSVKTVSNLKNNCPELVVAIQRLIEDELRAGTAL